MVSQPHVVWSLDSVKVVWERGMLTKLTSNMHIYVAVNAPSIRSRTLTTIAFAKMNTQWTRIVLTY